MTDLRAAAQQALEALNSVEWYGAGSGWMVDADAIEDAMTALRAALAKPVQEFCCEHAWKAAKEKAWSAVLKASQGCGCDHCEYCVRCWPVEFRSGGKWDAYTAAPSLVTPRGSLGEEVA